MHTLRTRTTLLATVLTAIVLVAGGWLLVGSLSSQLTHAGDDTSRQRLRDLREQAAGGSLPPVLDTFDDESMAQVIASDGTVLSATPNVLGKPAIIQPRTAGGAVLSVYTIAGPDDTETETYRVWVGGGDTGNDTGNITGDTDPVETNAGLDRQVTVVVGRSLESVSEATRTLRRSLLAGVPMVLLLRAAGIWVVVGRALRRVDAVTDAVSVITEAGSGRRVPESSVHDEVGRLAVTMNAMLTRLEESEERLRTFVADASHDLQSPLTALRTRLEVALPHPDQAEVTPLAREALATSAEMESLVAQLLETATDPPNTAPVRELVDIEDLVLEEVARIGAATQIGIDTGEVSAAPARVDPGELRRLVRNLLDNGVRHAASTVHVRVSADPDAAVVEVHDDGPGVPAELGTGCSTGSLPATPPGPATPDRSTTGSG